MRDEHDGGGRGPGYDPSADDPKAKALQSLAELAAEFTNDPLGFVLAAFPWGVPGSELANETGPDAFQAEVLMAVRDGLLNPGDVIRIALASGNGPGKSALACWLILWAITTLPDTRGVVTAGKESQLKTKTWAELARWHRLSLWRDWFALGATSIYSRAPARERTWRIDATPWSAENPESFAGLHNYGKRLLLVMDEGSVIPDPIWEVAEGALTDKDTQIIWYAAGNPTRNSGRFRECFGRLRHRWKCWQIDSRRTRRTNKEQAQQWVEDFGEDSDFVRVHVKGEFPRAGDMQFIAGDVVAAACGREVFVGIYDPLILGVDVARFGEDQSVIWFRKGRDARLYPPLKFRGLDTMELAARVAAEAARLRADAVFVDEGGLGAGVVDRLRQLRLPGVHGVNFGGKANRVLVGETPMLCANKRAEIWVSMREWLKHGAIPDDMELRTDLTGVEFGYNLRQEIQLESKRDMKARGLASPDNGDALALTFAYDVSPSPGAGGEHRPAMVQWDYDPLAGDAA